MTSAQRPDVIDHVASVPMPHSAAEIRSADIPLDPGETRWTVQTKSRRHLAFALPLLHALAQAGKPADAHGMQLSVGPNGGLIWTNTARDQTNRRDDA